MKKIKKVLIGLGLVSTWAVCMIGCSTPKEPVAVKVEEGIPEDSKKTIEVINNSLNTLYNSNAHITLNVGPNENDLIYMMYNKSKQCYSETGFDNSVRIYDGKGNCINMFEQVERVNDLSALELIEGCIDLLNNQYATATIGEVTNQNGDKLTSYTVEVTGKENIKRAFLKGGEDFATATITQLFTEEPKESKEGLEESKTGLEETKAGLEETKAGLEESKEVASDSNADSKDEKTDDYKMKIELDVNDEKAVSSICTFEMNGKSYISWWFDGYFALGDWKFDGDLEKDYTNEEWKEKALDVQSQIKTNIETFKKDNFSAEEMESIEAEIDKSKEPTKVDETVVDDSLSELSVVPYSEVMISNLKKDGLEGKKPEDYKVPEGMTEEDKAGMIEVYNKLSEWKEDKTNEVLTTPLTPDQLRLVEKYIAASKNVFETSGNDDCGFVFWMDTVGVHAEKFNKK